jgi:hypothetical protein
MILTIALFIVGVLALALGSGASKAFSDLGGSTILRVMGGLLVAGAVLVTSSVISSNALREVLGLVLMALGSSIYSGGALLGLGSQGLISGIGYAGIAVTLLSRVLFILRDAQAQNEL